MSRWLAIGLLAALLAYFNAGAEWMRAEKGRIRSAADFAARAPRLLWPPWRAAQLYVSHDGDEHLYFELTRALLGEEADLRYIAENQMGDVEGRLVRLRRLAASPGLHLDFPTSYPPLAAAVMLVPRLLVDSLPGYRLVFGAMMGACYLLSLWIGLRLARRCGTDPGAAAWLRRGVILLLALGPIVIQRFDILTATLTLCAVLFFVERRPLLAAAFIALGAGCKLYPLLLLPTWGALLLGLGGSARRTMLTLLAVLGIAGAMVGGAILVAAGSVGPLLADLHLFRSRPFQIESTVGSLALLLRGREVVSGAFGSHNASAPALDWLAARWDVVMALGMLGVAALAWRWARARRPIPEAAQAQGLCCFTVAALLILLCTSKVLSAQYVIWLLPLCALLPGARGRTLYRLLLLALVLTQLEFPVLYGLLLTGCQPVVALLVLRNAVLALMAGLCLAAAWRLPALHGPTASRGAGPGSAG